MIDGRARLFVATRRTEGFFRKRDVYDWRPVSVAQLHATIGDVAAQRPNDSALYAMTLTDTGKVEPREIRGIDRVRHPWNRCTSWHESGLQCTRNADHPPPHKAQDRTIVNVTKTEPRFTEEETVKTEWAEMNPPPAGADVREWFQPMPGLQLWASKPDGEAAHIALGLGEAVQVSMGGWRRADSLKGQPWRTLHVPDVLPGQQIAPSATTARLYKVEDFELEEGFKLSLFGGDGAGLVVGGFVVKL